MFLGFDFTPIGLIQHIVSGFFSLLVSALTDPLVGAVQGFFDGIFGSLFPSNDPLA